jgi:hypothetical protein
MASFYLRNSSRARRRLVCALDKFLLHMQQKLGMALESKRLQVALFLSAGVIQCGERARVSGG